MRPILKSFRASRSANVAITFAIALVPLIMFAGASIDYTRFLLMLAR